MLSLYATCSLVGFVALLTYSFWRRKYAIFDLIPSRKHRFYNVLRDVMKINLKADYDVQMFDLIGKVVNSFPKEPLVTVWISLFPLIFIKKSDAVRELLKTNKITQKSFQYNWLKPALGTGLITSSGEKWRSRRKLLNPCFHFDVLRNYLETFNKMSQKLVKELQKETQNDFTHIVDPMTLCALDAVCETIFGTKIEVSEGDKIQISNCIKRTENLFMERAYSFWLWPDLLFYNTKYGKEFKKQVNLLNEFIKKLIDATKDRYRSGERAIYNQKHRGVIDVLLEKHLDTQEFNEEDVREEVATFMTAGHDTIGLAAMWSVYLIGQHPEVQAKLHEEVDRVFGEDKERAVTEEDFKELQYMGCVLKECNRLYPPAPIVGRYIKEEVKICGYTIPKGTWCAVSIYNVHRDGDVFPDPEKFDPDRFSAENRVKIPEFAYIPFSAGPRNCIGSKFAEMEMGTIICYIFRNFTVETLNKVVPMPGVSLHPSEPVRIKIRCRASHET